MAPPDYVLWVPKWYPNPNDDQDGNFVEEHARALTSVGGRLGVIFGTYDPAPTAPLLRVEVSPEHGFPVARAFYRKRLTGLAPLDQALKLVLYFVGLTRAYRLLSHQLGGRPTLVHVHVLLRTGIWARLYRLVTGVPYVVSEHWSIYRPANAHRLGWWRRRLSAWVVRGARGVHTVSDELGAAMRTAGLHHPWYTTIPNVVDTALYCPPAGPREPDHLLHVSAFNEEAKNVKGLLRAVAALARERPSVRLTLVGYGPPAAEYHQLAHELGLVQAGHVTFTGKLDRPAVADLMRRAKAFVLFSNFENLPCVLIESLASGLPVVATRVGGIPELVEDGQTGLLIAPADEAALLTALRTILDGSARLAPVPELRARAESRYSLGAVGRALQQWYAQALAAPGSPAANLPAS